jgi:hypothetical protein
MKELKKKKRSEHEADSKQSRWQSFQYTQLTAISTQKSWQRGKTTAWLVFKFLEMGWEWDRRPLFGLLYQPRMMDDNKCATNGVIISRENRSTRRNRVSVSICPQQVPHDLTRAYSSFSTSSFNDSLMLCASNVLVSFLVTIACDFLYNTCSRSFGIASVIYGVRCRHSLISTYNHTFGWHLFVLVEQNFFFSRRLVLTLTRLIKACKNHFLPLNIICSLDSSSMTRSCCSLLNSS